MRNYTVILHLSKLCDSNIIHLKWFYFIIFLCIFNI